jgi:hypothetical protein
MARRLEQLDRLALYRVFGFIVWLRVTCVFERGLFLIRREVRYLRRRQYRRASSPR